MFTYLKCLKYQNESASVLIILSYSRFFFFSEFFREAGAKSKTLEEQVGKRTPLMEMKLESSMRFGPVERKRVQRDSRARLHITKLQSWQQREFHGIRALLGASSRTEVRTILKVSARLPGACNVVCINCRC